MVEGTGLENRHTGEPGIESSNLSLSASNERPCKTDRRDGASTVRAGSVFRNAWFPKPGSADGSLPLGCS